MLYFNIANSTAADLVSRRTPPFVMLYAAPNG